MLLIIAHHYVVNSGLMTMINQNPLAPNSIFLLLFGAWGKTGINCFLLITGYFMCKSEITMNKFVKQLSEVCFYNIVIYLIFCISGYTNFSLLSFIKTVFPIPAIQQNFTGCYLMFFLTIPFLNLLIRNMNQKQHLELVALLSFIYIVLGTIPKISVDMNYVTWYIVLYFIASYIRLYPLEIFNNTKFWGWMTIVMLFLSSASVVAGAWLGTKVNKQLYYYFVNDSNKILAVTTAVSAFLFFKNWKIGYSKFINTVAASTFGVLLIHANSDTMRRWLWVDVLNNVGMYESGWLILHAICSTIVIFVLCAAIDYLRIRIIERLLFK